jgi:hypothetical protein
MNSVAKSLDGGALRALVLLLAVASACAGTRELEMDRAYEAGIASVERLDVNVRRGRPAGVDVDVFGQLPDACTLIHRAQQDRRSTGITVTLTTRRESGARCPPEPRAYQRIVALDIQGMPPGLYFVSVNGVSTTFQIFPDSLAPNAADRYRTW